MEKALKYPVVNGMVAIEHVRYLQQNYDRLIEEVQWMLNALDSEHSGELGVDTAAAANRLHALLDQLGEL